MRIPRAARALTAACAAALTLFAAPASASAAVAVTEPTCTYTCVLDIRTATHPGFDRLVVDLGSGALPQWQVTTQDTPLQDMEGRTVPISGSSYLQLVLNGAQTFDTDYANTFEGPRHEQIDLPTLKGHAVVFSMESDTLIGLAAGEYASVEVFTLTAPNRVVIDLHR
ncbi:hypothetical protein V1J52_08865 [Streptomyces sp. TRM 70351]|uniref:AMIN-like domain-containing (lipo)protein n=1 Tax=Streptomyces sp. TRM 70351 TaxID=3116552 RepID=UPI002E7C2210|nr:hypothetical protein [Streptomyces sp. TRM 70351]MEE1928304.1 hypothetical protein [Streptomyces sp. TRM 70351]